MEARLELTAAELKPALAPFARFLHDKKVLGDAFIGFKDGLLVIDAGGITTTAKATGNWDGEARFPAHFVVLVAAQGELGSGRVEIRVRDGKLTLDPGLKKYDWACSWETSVRPPIVVPMDARLADFLVIGIRHSLQDIERAGVKEQVRDAQNQLEECVDQARIGLKPLGIMEPEIREFVMARVVRQVQ